MNQKRDEIKEIREEVHATKTQLEEDLKRTRTEVDQEVKTLKGESFSDTFRHLFSLTDDVASHSEIRERILTGGKFNGTNMIVLILAILIASVGLNTGSTAVIIGAMLISPLMGNLLAMAYATASVDRHTFGIYSIGLIAKIVISVGTSAIYFALSPVKEATAELIARTNPTFFDIIIAICGGLAGIVGQTRKDKANNIIPGVAIATALMPPLCTCGYAIAIHSLSMFLGAGYLFIVNSYFIYLSSTWILSILQVPHVGSLSEHQWKALRWRMFRNAALITIPTVLAGVAFIFE